MEQHRALQAWQFNRLKEDPDADISQDAYDDEAVRTHDENKSRRGE